MFKYNELTDLINGSLVTPLSKMDDGTICCLDDKGNECFYSFKDFDFRKKPEERKLNSDNLESEVGDLIDNSKNDSKEENDLTYQDMLDEMEKDDSIFDGTDEPEVDPSNPDAPVKEYEGFCNNLEIQDILNLAGIEKKPGVRYTVWKDII